MRSLMSVSPFNPARESLVAVFDEIRKKVSFQFFLNFSSKIPTKIKNTQNLQNSQNFSLCNQVQGIGKLCSKRKLTKHFINTDCLMTNVCSCPRSMNLVNGSAKRRIVRDLRRKNIASTAICGKRRGFIRKAVVACIERRRWIRRWRAGAPTAARMKSFTTWMPRSSTNASLFRFSTFKAN